MSRIAMIVFFALGVLGCSRTSQPNPSDPKVGRETLTQALEAWKSGSTHEAYKQTAPSVTVVDEQWKGGYKLVEYEIAPDTVHEGFDVQFKARLEVKDPAGRQSKARAVYNVSTTPALVIVRAMD